jgi:hypothetical protein
MEGEGRKREEQSPIVPKMRELRADLGQGVKDQIVKHLEHQVE